MALTLIATSGASNANSYATQAEADAFFEAHLYASDWTASTSKDAALVMATRTLDAMVDWSGYIASDTQALQWPRSGMYYRDGLYSIPVNVIPTDLKNAVAEFARALIVEDRTAENDIEANKLRSLKAGPVELSFDPGVSARVIPDSVLALLPASWFMLRSLRGGTGNREVVRA